jgi:hypothetical protein
MNIFYAISRARPCPVSGESRGGSGNLRALACVPGLAQLGLGIIFGFLSLGNLSAQDFSLSPTRPTIANGVSIQDKGVLQVETGYDAYPQRVPGNQQTVAVSLSYVPLERLRLDYGLSAFSHQESDDGEASGVGTIQVGGKVVLFKENYHRAAPGIAVQYEAELPAASNRVLQSFGQQFILLLNHHYGRNGVLDVIVNASLVQSDCQTPKGCSYGDQQSFALSYHLQKQTRLYAEVFGQNNSQSNTPPGTYAFGGFYHQFSHAFGLDGGMRFGVTDHSARVGTTIGLVFGKRLHPNPASQRHRL